MKKLIAGLGIGAALAFAAPTTAEAQGPVVTGGLVNVTIVDLADVTLQDINIGVGAALALAANVCDVNVLVLVADFEDGSATCTNTVSGTEVTLTQLTGRRR